MGCNGADSRRVLEFALAALLPGPPEIFFQRLIRLPAQLFVPLATSIPPTGIHVSTTAVIMEG